MVRGMILKWKQAVGYFLTSGTMNADMLKDLLLSCISKMLDIGLKVKLVVCDKGSNNRSMIEKLKSVSFFAVFYPSGHKDICAV